MTNITFVRRNQKRQSTDKIIQQLKIEYYVHMIFLLSKV